jgi:CheY-like chemotaxis protein
VGCDRLLGEEEVLVKALGPLLQGVHGYLGAAILGDGGIALLLDPSALTRSPASRVPRRAATRRAERGGTAPREGTRRRGLVHGAGELQRSILESAGYRVEIARDGVEALERVSRDDGIDLVLTDVEMPEMDGLELTRAIRRHAERSSLPVVILTSQAREEDRQAGVEAGADAFMVKRAFDQHALLETVERLVGR